jgi:hypothetical protein
MNTRAVKLCLAAISVLILLVPSLNADWSEGGIQLSTEPADQYNQQVISDGSGGAIVVWQDDRNGMSNMDIFAQRFNSDGDILWDAAGVNISQLGLQQVDPVLATDGAGGAIIVYKSDRAGTQDIIAQRILSNGTVAWPAGGITVCGAGNVQTDPCIVSDDIGGAIVAWSDYRSGTSYDIYAARIDASGNMPWTFNGVPVCTSADAQVTQVITTDGSSGAIIAWRDDRNGNEDIYAQKIIFNGSYAWTNNGNAVVNNIATESSPSIVSDMNGGAVIAWTEGVTSAKDIMAQRMLSDGTQAWNPGTGVSVCTHDEIQSSSRMVSDGAGGAIIAWLDNRNLNQDIYAQHIDYAGGSDWITDGVLVCWDASTQYEHGIVSDGHGGAIIFWTDLRFQNNYEIFGQRIGSDGLGKWQSNGLNLTSYPSYQVEAQAVANGDGGIIVAWKDSRDLNNNMSYAQKYDRYGYWGDPAPVITGAGDVPSDQGGQVLLEWAPIRMDEYPEVLITHYTIWRSISAPMAMAFMDEGTLVASPGEIGLDFEGTAFRTDIAFGAAAAWEWVASVDAHYWDEYAYTCGTLFDYSEGDDAMHYFVISANTADPFTFWDSAPDSAFSIDNLAPCAPMGIAGEQSFQPAGLELSWSPNSEADLGGYNIYRGTDPTFEPGPGNLLATTCDTLLLDGGWSWDSGFCYKVAAVDVHGNESDYATLCIEQVTGDDPMPVPDATFLAQNYPNPFNPSTTISFGLKDSGHVSLRIYDAAGRLVRELTDGTRPAGHYAETWNGMTDGGSRAASGVYFYRLTAGTFIETKKMILLR